MWDAPSLTSSIIAITPIEEEGEAQQSQDVV